MRTIVINSKLSSKLLCRLLLIGCVLIVMVFTALARPAVTHVLAEEDCGIVDAIDYPIDSVSIDHDDFGMFRATDNGRHTGIDMAFDRYGEPVRASARGRVTFSDPAGWDTEKGVVIIEHTFPDHSTFFSLYGHMEQTNGHTFPKVGNCVAKGDIIGSVGHPMHSAPHLHYEIRKMRASTGGPGYWPVEPLDGGWMHPIDFTEAWQLRLTPAYRAMLTAGGGPTAPPLWQPDGGAVFAEETHLEQRSKDGQSLWQVDVLGLTGIINLADGRILGRTADDQIVIVANGRFVDTWKADRALRSGPMRIGADGIAFLTADNRIVLYDPKGNVRWQTDPLGEHVEHAVQSGDTIAVAAESDNASKLWLVDASGKIVYQGTAPAPITPMAVNTANPGSSFIVMVGTQISFLGSDHILKPFMDVGQSLGRNSQVAIDPQGNVLLYPGQGVRVYDYAANGVLRWQVTLPMSPSLPPLLGVGSGCLAYMLTGDGSLLAYGGADGALHGIATLYAGGPHSHAAARFLSVSSTDKIAFSAGYLSTATVDGPTLANIDSCQH